MFLQIVEMLLYEFDALFLQQRLLACDCHLIHLTHVVAIRVQFEIVHERLFQFIQTKQLNKAEELKKLLEVVSLQAYLARVQVLDYSFERVDIFKLRQFDIGTVGLVN